MPGGRGPAGAVPREVRAFGKQVDGAGGVGRTTGLLRPVVRAENDVAIKPGNLIAILRHSLQGDVKETLFLPHHIPAVDPDENVGVVVVELKTAVEREFNGDKGDAKTPAEDTIVLKTPLVSNRVEVAGDRP